MTAVQALMAKAIEDAPLTLINLVVPYNRHFKVCAPVKTLGQMCFVLPVAPHWIECYEILHELSPDLPVTLDHCRAYAMPKNWQDINALERARLVDYAIEHNDEATMAFMLTLACARIERGDWSSSVIFVRNLTASRLCVIEAEYYHQRIERTCRPALMNGRQLTAYDYMNLYWGLVAVGHVQLSGTEYNTSMVADFNAAQRAVSRTMEANNRL